MGRVTRARSTRLSGRESHAGKRSAISGSGGEAVGEFLTELGPIRIPTTTVPLGRPAHVVGSEKFQQLFDLLCTEATAVSSSSM